MAMRHMLEIRCLKCNKVKKVQINRPNSKFCSRHCYMSYRNSRKSP
jgi:endogenous inhibitor of DNA gyrase (YacG/DUF329 family)